jgi:hypothetical protein
LAYLVEGFRVFRLKEVFWYSECGHNRLEIKLEILGFFFKKCERVVAMVFWVLKFVVEVRVCVMNLAN